MFNIRILSYSQRYLYREARQRALIQCTYVLSWNRTKLRMLWNMAFPSSMADLKYNTMSIIYMLKYFEEIYKHICISKHFSTLRCHGCTFISQILPHGKQVHVLIHVKLWAETGVFPHAANSRGQYHEWLWPGNAGTQGISNNEIYLLFTEPFICWIVVNKHECLFCIV